MSHLGNQTHNGKITIYYDGLCRLCSAEISHYMKNPFSSRIRFVDITSPLFDASLEGVDPVMVHKVMHVRDVNNVVIQGADAFIEIWKTLPSYNFLGKVVSLPVLIQLFRLFYSVFAFVRPFLPRKKQMCANSPFCDAP